MAATAFEEKQEEQVQYEGSAVLYGLCMHARERKQVRGRGQGTIPSNDADDNTCQAMQEIARHEGAVAVLKAARLRYPLNDDLQTYASAVLITLGQKAPEGTQETKCIVNDFKEVATTEGIQRFSFGRHHVMSFFKKRNCTGSKQPEEQRAVISEELRSDLASWDKDGGAQLMSQLKAQLGNVDAELKAKDVVFGERKNSADMIRQISISLAY